MMGLSQMKRRARFFTLHLFLFSFVLTCIFKSVFGFLDMEELKSMSYEVDILSTPVLMSQDPSPQILYMTSKYGQQYQCKLPDVVIMQGGPENQDSSNENVPDVIELLEPMRKAPCLVKTKDWWTYDFCYGYFMRQYHVSDSVIDGPISILGIYDRDYNWNNESSKDAPSKNQSNRYHSQYYVNGTVCDLTGQPRKAEIRFYCEEDAGDYIYRVDEPETCAYVVTIHTSRLCNHPYFKPVQDKSPHMISCSPMLAEDQYKEYLQEVEEQKQAAEEKRKAWIQKQQERVKSIRKLLDGGETEKDVASDGSQADSVTVVKDAEASDSVPKDDKSPNVEESSSSKPLEQSEKSDSSSFKKTDPQGEDNDNDIIEKLKEEITKKSILGEYKESLQKEITDQFGSILEEAEEELQVDMDDDMRNTAFNKLAATLNRLLDKLDKAEKHVAIATEELERAKNVMSNKDQESKSTTKSPLGKDEDDTVEIDDKVESDDLIDEGNKIVKVQDDDGNIESSERLRVRLRKADGTSSADGKLQMFQQHELDEAQKKRLEKVVKEKLEQAGLETSGRRIEVKIITAGYYDNEDTKDVHVLSEEETQQFQNMILTLLTGNQEAVQEMERQRRLEKNYEFVWGKSRSIDNRKTNEQSEEDK